MKEFFHGWRRKAGLVSLVLACLLMLVWIRSFLVCNIVQFSHGERCIGIGVLSGSVIWYGFSSERDTPVKWTIYSEPPNNVSMMFQMLMAIDDAPEAERFQMWKLPHGPLVAAVVLAALSFLWRPGKVRPSESLTNPNLHSN